MYNPLPNWRILVNATKQEASRGAPDELLAEVIADRQPYWSLPGVKDLIASPSWTRSTYAKQNIQNPYALRLLQTGTPATELRR